jgi:hypothetical protein
MIALQVIAERIRAITQRDPSKNLLAAIAEIERLIDEAISGAAIRAPVSSGEDLKQLFDLSTIDFERLALLFAQGQKKTAAETLRWMTEVRARGFVGRNPTRADFLERLNNLIDRYNAGSMDVERLFEELTAFVQSMDEEKKRHAKEGLTEEELAIFDILTRPEPKLSKAQELEVKKIARQLLDKLKREKFILDWQMREPAKAGVREAIRQEFDLLPEVYDRKLWDEKVELSTRLRAIWECGERASFRLRVTRLELKGMPLACPASTASARRWRPLEWPRPYFGADRALAPQFRASRVLRELEKEPLTTGAFVRLNLTRTGPSRRPVRNHMCWRVCTVHGRRRMMPSARTRLLLAAATLVSGILAGGVSIAWSSVGPLGTNWAQKHGRHIAVMLTSEMALWLIRYKPLEVRF